jgi:hypothetical protein
LLAESSAKPLKKPGKPVLGTNPKIGRDMISSITLKGLEQGNFSTFSTTGDTVNNGANICITLTFA